MTPPGNVDPQPGARGDATSKHLIPRLLAGKNRLSRPEKDAIFENVLAQVSPTRRSRWWPPVLALAGAVAAVVVIPLVIGGDKDDPEFAARGQRSAVAAFVLVCSGEASDVCQHGDKLVFDLRASAGYRYFASFARHDDGTVLWYFPESPDGRSLDLRRRLSDGVLDRGVVIASDHRPGRFQVFGIFSNEPLSRDDIKARFQPGASDVGQGTAITIEEFTVP